ncbi:MAG TPA: hypothetical protein VM073_05645 [Usitatibacter sp.]|nr:hypothetical protein [Usitatibacter sp.]
MPARAGAAEHLVGDSVITLPGDHPAFAGHFPGRPIVPAVVILAEVLSVVETTTGTRATDWEIANAKFLRPVGPGASLALRHDRLDHGGIRFEVRSGPELVANGLLSRRPS